MGWATLAYQRQSIFGTVVDRSQIVVTVHRGERLSLVVPDRETPEGDRWTVRASTDGVIREVERRFIPSGILWRLFAPRADGARYFVLEALRPGRTCVILTNQPATSTWLVVVEQ